MQTFAHTIGFSVITCECGVTYGLPDDFIASRRKSHKTFYCPNGCARHYPQKNEAEKLRDELERAQGERDRARIRQNELRRERDDIRKAHRKMRVRVVNGVCPCCNRTFQNLRDHMATKHPDFGTPQTVRALREAFGMTQAQVADECGTRPNYVSMFERGKPVPAEAAESLQWWLDKNQAAA